MSVATANVEQPGVLKGPGGAVNLNAIKLCRSGKSYLNLLSEVSKIGLSEKDSEKVYNEVVNTLKVKSIEDVLYLLVWFAKQNISLPIREQLFDKVVAWFDKHSHRVHEDRCAEVCARAIYQSFDKVYATDNRRFVLVRNSEGKEFLCDYAIVKRNRDLVLKAYPKMQLLGKYK